MRHVSTVFVLLVFCGGAHAIPMPPVPDPEVGTGYLYLHLGDIFAYNHVTGLVTYRATGGDLYSSSVPVMTGVNANLIGDRMPAVFEWTAVVDEARNFKFGGAATLAIDFGDGLELVASGTVLQFDFGDIFCGQSLCTGLRPWALIENTYSDGRYSYLFEDFLLWGGSLFMSVGTPTSNLDVVCGATRLESVNCDHWSSDYIFGYRAVPEPELMSLLALGIGVAVCVRRRRSS